MKLRCCVAPEFLIYFLKIFRKSFFTDRMITARTNKKIRNRMEYITIWSAICSNPATMASVTADIFTAYLPSYFLLFLPLWRLLGSPSR